MSNRPPRLNQRRPEVDPNWPRPAKARIKEWDARLSGESAAGRITAIQELLNNHPGQAAQLTVHALILGFAVTMYNDHDPHLMKVWNTLRAMPRKWRRTLGISSPDHLSRSERHNGALFHELTYDQFQHTFDRFGEICEKLDSAENQDDTTTYLSAANRLVNEIIDSTVTPENRAATTVALDGSVLETWARTQWKDPAEPGGKKTATSKDPAAHFGHGPNRNGRTTGYENGFEIEALVPVADGPLQTTAILPHPNHTGERRRTVALLHELVERPDAELAHVLFDGGYHITASDWARPLAALGVDLTFDPHPDQRLNTKHDGAAIIDSQPFCPFMPARFHDLPKVNTHAPDEDADDETKEAAREAAVELRGKYDERQRYSFKRNGKSRNGNAQRWMCPAEAGLVICPRKPELATKFGLTQGDEMIQIPDDAPPPLKCCTQRTITIDPKVTDTHGQKHPYGTTKWFDAYKKRVRVETGFSGIKNNIVNLRRGSIRVFGEPKTTLIIGLATAVANVVSRNNHETEKRQQARREQSNNDSPSNAADAEEATAPATDEHPATGPHDQGARQSELTTPKLE